MTEVEQLTLTISGLALLISAWNFYRIHFYKTAILIGQISTLHTQAKDNSHEMEFWFSMANSGNVEVLIHEIILNLSPWSKNELVPEVTSSDLPTVIKPGEIKLIYFRLPSQFIFDVGGQDVTIELQFDPTTSQGEIHPMRKSLKPIISEDSIPPSWLAPFKMDSSKWWVPNEDKS